MLKGTPPALYMQRENMDIIRSSRHQKIIGAFGEHLISNHLSRSGFEVANIDHTGIDLIAYHNLTKQRLGISIKSRTRTAGTENTPVNMLSYQGGKNDRKKLIDACKAFDCEPWIGIYVETTEYAEVYLTSLKNYDKKYRNKNKRAIDVWRMNATHRERYERDINVKHIRFDYHATNWKWGK
jgi:hypothetical protein